MGENQTLIELLINDNKHLFEGLIEEAFQSVKENNFIPKKHRTKIDPSRPENRGLILFKKLMSVLTAHSQLEKTIAIMHSYRRNKRYVKLKISKDIWIRYHFSNFIGELITIEDTVLILTNAIYALGNPDQYCTYDLISKNIYLSRSTKFALSKLHKELQEFRTPRNLKAHQGELFDLEELDGISFIELMSDLDEDVRKESAKLRKLLYKDALIPIEKMCVELHASVGIHLDEIFDSLANVYKKNLV